MQNIWTIAKREYDNYFASPLAYVIAAGLLFLLGGIFLIILQGSIQQAIFGGGTPVDIGFINQWFYYLLVWTVPALTMRLISDENRTGTLELLLTAPVRDYELVIGKWLGSFLYILSVIGVSFIFAIVANYLAEPGIDQVKMMSSYLGLILISGALLALGTGISALFNNQIAAFFVTLALFIILWLLIGIPASFFPTNPAIGDVFRYLQIGNHYDTTFNSGVLYLSDVIYFLSLIAIGLFTGVTAVDSRRWR